MCRVYSLEFDIVASFKTSFEFSFQNTGKLLSAQSGIRKANPNGV